MRKAFIAFSIVFLCSLFTYGQETSAKNEADSKQNSTVKFFQGEDYMPFIFEPYRAEYVFRGNIIGLNFNFFHFSTDIVELSDQWQETQKWRITLPDEEPQNIEIISHIDLKTGLLIKLIANFGKYSSEYLIGDTAIEAVAANGKKTKQISFANREKIYPCSFSNTFLSYLPLNENFAGSFVCFQPDEDKNGKPIVSFHKRTLHVFGTERITVDGGTFDCYKLADETEEIKYNADGSVKKKKRRENKSFDEEKIWKSFYSNSWIDKRTRKFVKGELKFKYGAIAVELQKSSRQRDL